jgi:tRNA pseudouridine32 synthase/23S rRNA pseudouridine746 synthase
MQTNKPDNPRYFTYFQTDVAGIALPEKFDYPFFYTPHEIALTAARELQNYLLQQQEWEHDFGFHNSDGDDTIGKMFGVLVVRNVHGEIGYLCAVSGKLAGSNEHPKFVPPVFDILQEDSFFKKGETIISAINQRIAALEEAPDFLAVKNQLATEKTLSENEITAFKKHQQIQRAQRHAQRLMLESSTAGEAVENELRALEHQSIAEHYHLKQLKKKWKLQLELVAQRVATFQAEIDQLKEERKSRSAALQQEIFDHFYFVNQALEKRSVGDIFKYTTEGKPKAGAGECAAPKLLQYAFLNQLHPIAMAEFWWGQSPKTEIRKHAQFYPACRGKCEPILGHMLQGLPMNENPLLHVQGADAELEVVWEDEHLVMVNKPHEFLSVPGKKIDDSVYTRLKIRYPQHPELLVVHRLDMSTSGILIAAKSLEVYRAMQRLFTERLVKKRYVAVLEGSPKEDSGWIDLPLRVNLEDRPRQQVCWEHGKSAQTRWEVVNRTDVRTRVHFYPITGRTHQLRVHAAHVLGLNCPIVGDDLYGTRSERLHLHAERVEFSHPVTHDMVVVEVKAEF